MNYKTVVAGIFLASIIIACQTDDVAPTNMYLKEIVYSKFPTEQFEYQNGQLSSYKQLFGNRVPTLTNFTYEGGQLKTVEIGRDDGINYLIELDYHPNGLRARERKTYKENDQLIRVTTIEFSYNETGQLIHKRNTSTDPNFNLLDTEYEWTNGNISRATSFQNTDQGRIVFSSMSFRFDNKRNYTNQDLAFIYTNRHDAVVFSRNNLISGSITYQYNENGYPVEYSYTIEGKKFPALMIYE